MERTKQTAKIMYSTVHKNTHFSPGFFWSCISMRIKNVKPTPWVFQVVSHPKYTLLPGSFPSKYINPAQRQTANEMSVGHDQVMMNVSAKRLAAQIVAFARNKKFMCSRCSTTLTYLFYTEENTNFFQVCPGYGCLRIHIKKIFSLRHQVLPGSLPSKYTNPHQRSLT